MFSLRFGSICACLSIATACGGSDDAPLEPSGKGGGHTGGVGPKDAGWPATGGKSSDAATGGSSGASGSSGAGGSAGATEDAGAPACLDVKQPCQSKDQCC